MEKIPGDKALLVGSIARKSGREYHHSFGAYLRQTDDPGDGERISITASDGFFGGVGKFDDDFADDDSSGSLFVASVSPGAFEIHGFYVGINGLILMNEIQFKTDEGLTVPFLLEAGHVHYLGELLADGMLLRMLPGWKVAGGDANWTIRNMFDRDIELLRQRYPALDWDAATSLFPDGWEIGGQ